MDKRYTFEELKKIIADLRGEGGCPWDREQTHESLKSCMMEEAAELLAAIRIYAQTGSSENMEEELGDILLQVVMHSRIAEEEGLFTLEDVINGISAKMVRRHPHVFGDAEAETAEQVLANWEDIKSGEKEGKSWIPSPLREVPGELPALTRAQKVLKKIDKLYRPGIDYPAAVDKLQSSVAGLKALEPVRDDGELDRIMGDILINMSEIAILCKISQEQLLTDRIEDLIEKYEPVIKE